MTINGRRATKSSPLIDTRKYDDALLLGRILCELDDILSDNDKQKIMKHFEKINKNRECDIK